MDEMINKYDVRDELWNERVNIAREKLSIHSENLALQLEDSMENLSLILRQRTDDFEHLLTDKYEKRIQEKTESAITQFNDHCTTLEQFLDSKFCGAMEQMQIEYDRLIASMEKETMKAKESQESEWRDFDMFTQGLKDDKNYLIRWHDADGKYNVPHMAYWLEEEKSFFFLHIDCSIPARVHQYMEIPE